MKPTNLKSSHWLHYNFLFFLEHFLGHRNYRSVFGNMEKNLFSSIDQYVSEQNSKNQFEIIEYKNGEWEEPLHHPYYPKVFRGAALDWACCKKWSFEYFEEQYGETEVTLLGNEGLIKNSIQNWDKIKLRDYISQLKAGSKMYLKFSQMIHDESELQDDFVGDWLQKFQMSKMRNHFFLFMGGKGTVTPIHNGMPPTVFVQITGQKKWFFYPASDRLFLGVRPERRSYFFSHADPHDESNPDFPLLKHANKKELILNAGDVLWFPAFVWHQVENVTDSIGVAYKFTHLPSAFTSSKMLATLFFLSTKPWLIESVIAHRRTGRIYMFERPN